MVRSEAGLYEGWATLAHDQQCGPGQQSQPELRFRHGTTTSLASPSDVNFLLADPIMVSIRNDVSPLLDDDAVA